MAADGEDRNDEKWNELLKELEGLKASLISANKENTELRENLQAAEEEAKENSQFVAQQSSRRTLNLTPTKPITTSPENATASDVSINVSNPTDNTNNKPPDSSHVMPNSTNTSMPPYLRHAMPNTLDIPMPPYLSHVSPNISNFSMPPYLSHGVSNTSNITMPPCSTNVSSNTQNSIFTMPPCSTNVSSQTPNITMPPYLTNVVTNNPSTCMPPYYTNVSSTLPNSYITNVTSNIPNNTNASVRTNNMPPYMSNNPTDNLYLSSNTSPYGNNNVPNSQHRHFNLRKLQDLPEFSGLPEHWPMFFTAYKRTTEVYCYTNLENQSRLQKALKGAARTKVEALLIYPDSVLEVMRQLEFHYGRPQLLIKSQISKVKAYPPIHGNKAKEVVDFSALVTNLIVFLQNADAASHLNNPTLVEELVNKLPTYRQEEWYKHIFIDNVPNPTVCDFGSWLNTVATYLSLTPSFYSNKVDAATSRAPKPNFTILEERGNLNCVMCNGVYRLYKCNKFRNTSVNERWELVKKTKLCFSCLNAKHNASGCSFRKECGINFCKKIHNRLLHDTKDGTKNPVMEEMKLPVTTVNTTEVSKKTLLKFVPVIIKGPKGNCSIMAFIDEGSKVSLIDEKVTQLLGFKGNKSMLSLQWIGGKTINELSQRVTIDISGQHDNSNTYTLKNIRTTKNLELPSQSLELQGFKSKYDLLKDVTIRDYKNATPQMLIGMPHVNLIRPSAIINLDEHFTVHNTKIGNILFGSNEEDNDAVVYVVNYQEEFMVNMQKQIAEYFSLEDFGVKICKPVTSDDEKRAEKILNDTTKKIGNRYETGLLWKTDDNKYQDTYEMALKRLTLVEKKMEKDKELASWYQAKIEEYVQKTYARKLSNEEACIINNRTWYLPHFAVLNVNKGNKRRLVFDAAAQIKGISFNSRLSKGPEAYQPKSLVDILLNFRQRKIGVCADIKEMFHQVIIRKEDQDAQRFLWRNGDAKKPPDVYIMRAMIFGSVSSPCSAQFVKNLNAKRFESENKRAAKAITERHYVDDFVDSFDSIQEAVEVSKDVVRIHKEAGFELRGFVSNASEVRGHLNEAPTCLDNATTNICNSEITEKILGMQWCPSEDFFTFKLKFARIPQDVLIGLRRPKKSEVLGLAMSIFDPYGIVACHTITSKIIMQEVWRTSTTWEMPIPENIYEKWFKWYTTLPMLERIRIPRCYNENFTNSDAEIELHIFVDASEMAYAAVAYWRITVHGTVTLSFVMGKSRCSPVKPLSIPRLELQAAVLGVRLAETIIRGHDVTPKTTFYWSDSKTVMNWVHSDCRKYKQFVACRIAEILNYSETGQWNWVPGPQNPADEATRLTTKPKNYECKWITGPEFLLEPRDSWPKLPGDITCHEQQQEQRAGFLFTTSCKPNLVKYANFSNYYRLVRCVAWVLRAVSIFKAKQQRNHNETHLTAAEIKNAEMRLCKMVQAEVYYEEVQWLSQGKPIPKKSHIYGLTPTLDDHGVLRLSGRIENAQCVTPNVKRPIIMPKDHAVTWLLIKNYHEENMHQNQLTICAAIRRKFWIPSLRQRVRSYNLKCQLCKNLSAKPKPPLMGQLPEGRLKPFVRPFTYTGLDYFGPIMVTIGRRQEKRWVALFTCLTVRAVHLELAKDLSADAVTLCIKNFVNRRGVPVRIRCDRGTNFVGASRDETATICECIANECSRKNIEWVFNTPANPSAGGAWERMVQSVKKVLSFTVKAKAPHVETMNSLLIEAENLINSRPLTELPMEPDAAEPLTPNHFLIGTSNCVQTPYVGEKSCPRKQWQVQQQLKQTFWKRWVLEYLPELTRRTKWHQHVTPIKIGDVVIVCDENQIRGEWKMGLVTEVFPAADRQVRSAMVKTATGFLRRPASKLAVLNVLGEPELHSVHGGEDVGI